MLRRRPTGEECGARQLVTMRRGSVALRRGSPESQHFRASVYSAVQVQLSTARFCSERRDPAVSTAMTGSRFTARNN